MKRDPSKAITVFALMIAAVGCGAGYEPLVPGEPVDAARPVVRDAAVDVSRPRDGASTPDATAPRDVASAPDAAPRDVAATPDAAAPRDVASTPDATVPRDAAPDVAADVPPDYPPLPSGTSEWFPAFDSATAAHVREVRARGEAMGMRPNVFAKIGDSITESASYLQDIGSGWYDLGAYAALEPTVTYFRAVRFADGSNSLNRASGCAMGGWIARYALYMEPMSALRYELSYTRPAYALVMYGTNDLDYMDAAAFTNDMGRVLDVIEANGTVAVLSTIPDRLDRPDAAARVPVFNDAIRALAEARHLPLMDYWRACQALPRHGIEADGIHPSIYTVDGNTVGGVLTANGLRYGYNMRNLVSLVAVDALRNFR